MKRQKGKDVFNQHRRKYLSFLIAIIALSALLFSPMTPDEAYATDWCKGTIGDFVWEDTNGDGTQNDGDTGINGVTVKITGKDFSNPPRDIFFDPADEESIEMSIVTSTGGPPDSDPETHKPGYYLFKDLCAGNYIVTVDQTTLPPGLEPTPECSSDQNIGNDSNANGADSDDCTPEQNVVLPFGENNNFNNPTIDFGFVGGTPECDLTVEKFCSEPIPPSSGNDCDGKVTEMVFEYTGDECANPLANPQEGKAKCNDPATLDEPVSIEWAGKDASKILISPNSGITTNNNYIISVTAPGRGGGEFPADSKFAIRNKVDDLAQSLEIHTSCSKSLAVGDVFGSFRLIELTSTNGGTIGLPEPDPVTPSDPGLKLCEAEAVQPGSCADGKPKALVFNYTGDPCSESSNDQGDKAKCSGDLNGEAPIEILYTGKDSDKITVSPSGQTIEPGDSVTVEATGRDDLKSETKLKILQDGDLLQELTIHTSCSQPLNIGDQFGSMLLEEFIPKGSVVVSENVIYTYRITSSTDVTVDVVDNKLDLGPDANDLFIPAGVPVELEASVLLSDPGSVTNVVTVTDIKDPTCFAEDEVTVDVVEPPEPPAACDDQSKVAVLTLEYTSETCAASDNAQDKPDERCIDKGVLADTTGIVVTKDPDKVTATYNEPFGVGTLVTFTHTGGKLGGDTAFDIVDASGEPLQSLKIHTSCSKALVVGDQFGSMKVDNLDLIPK